jgi:putative transposase
MQRFQSYKFELRPTGPQQRQMRRIAGCCRFVFNGALAIQMRRRDLGVAPMDYAALNRQLTQWRRQPETIWLADVPLECLQQSLRNLERAFARYLRSQSQYPVYKRRGRSDSFYHKSNEIRLDQTASRVHLPKLGWVRYRNSRAVLGRIASVTISAAGERWFVSTLAGREVEPQVAHRPAIGIDMGVVRFATLSDWHDLYAAQQFQASREGTGCGPTFLEPKSQVQQQLEKGEKASPTHPHPDRQCAPRLPA